MSADLSTHFHKTDKLSPINTNDVTLGIDVAKAFLGAYKATFAHYFQKWTSFPQAVTALGDDHHCATCNTARKAASQHCQDHLTPETPFIDPHPQVSLPVPQPQITSAVTQSPQMTPAVTQPLQIPHTSQVQQPFQLATVQASSLSSTVILSVMVPEPLHMEEIPAGETTLQKALSTLTTLDINGTNFHITREIMILKQGNQSVQQYYEKFIFSLCILTLISQCTTVVIVIVVLVCGGDLHKIIPWHHFFFFIHIKPA
ncbi:hypothetical protein Pelo_12681 [Pelomyxa schiedti]|nr:hypothetical protein Pelo_12681 [Pelomyxa schiedti]